MIYFIDDDVNQMWPFRNELEEQGYQVKALRNADEAFDHLEQAQDIELVIMDVMIGTGPKQTSRFSAAETDDFLKTGLVLVDKLMQKNASKLQKRLLVFSMAHQIPLVGEIEKTVNKYNITYLRKPDYADPYEFCKKLAALGFITLKP